MGTFQHLSSLTRTYSADLIQQRTFYENRKIDSYAGWWSMLKPNTFDSLYSEIVINFYQESQWMGLDYNFEFWNKDFYLIYYYLIFNK